VSYAGVGDVGGVGICPDEKTGDGFQVTTVYRITRVADVT
jgi:hypothetical protein